LEYIDCYIQLSDIWFNYILPITTLLLQQLQHCAMPCRARRATTTLLLQHAA